MERGEQGIEGSREPKQRGTGGGESFRSVVSGDNVARYCRDNARHSAGRLLRCWHSSLVDRPILPCRRGRPPKSTKSLNFLWGRFGVPRFQSEGSGAARLESHRVRSCNQSPGPGRTGAAGNRGAGRLTPYGAARCGTCAPDPRWTEHAIDAELGERSASESENPRVLRAPLALNASEPRAVPCAGQI